MSTQDDFNWNDVEEDLVVPEQAAIAVYNNPRNDLVVRQTGRFGNDEDHFVVIQADQDADPADHKREKAAERQRRRREKQRQRDNQGGETEPSVPQRGYGHGTSVTTAPALPELDLHGGEHQALTH
jgi:hypothetical protein